MQCPFGVYEAGYEIDWTDRASSMRFAVEVRVIAYSLCMVQAFREHKKRCPCSVGLHIKSGCPSSSSNIARRGYVLIHVHV